MRLFRHLKIPGIGKWRCCPGKFGRFFTGKSFPLNPMNHHASPIDRHLRPGTQLAVTIPRQKT